MKRARSGLSALLAIDSRTPVLVIGLSLLLCAGTALLIWIGYDAVRTSRLSQQLLRERRQAEQLALLWAGISQDMRGAHASILAAVDAGQVLLEPPYDLADTFARGFARFPYPESFFAWRSSDHGEEAVYAFNRAERPPAWLTPVRLSGPYPVDVVRNPEPLAPVIAEAKRLSRYIRPFAVFNTQIGSVTYQVVIRYFYADTSDLSSFVGFTVNPDWVRAEYFSTLVPQLSRIGGAADEVALSIVDDTGQLVTATRNHGEGIAPIGRTFPLLFADPSLLGVMSLEGTVFPRWTARAVTDIRSSDGMGASREVTLLLIALSATAVLMGLVATTAAARASARVATMKSDFVSGVTHELKTPLAVIALVAETFLKGRYDSAETMREYASLLSQESRTLTRLIDNLLAYSGLTDIRRAFTFEPFHIEDILDDVLRQFQVLLRDKGFVVNVDAPPDLPQVRADRTSLKLALDNIIDNAIKYSEAAKELKILASTDGPWVVISVIDRGRGIPSDELARIGERFVRGRGVTVEGSGMGLTITRMIVEAHIGLLSIESEVGQGTRVDVRLPGVTRP